MRRVLSFLLWIWMPAAAFSQPVIQLELYASGFDDPVDIASAGDGRLFIVERAGIIKIIDESGVTLGTDFLNITDKIESGYDEQGLLGLVFAPDYTTSGFFYVYYIDNDENDILARYKVSTIDANIADEASEQIIFEADDPFVNHNAGDLNFGPDGYLYFGMGDGGSAGDPGNRAQDPEEKLGKMHRINVTGEDTYSIPADNPYAGSTDTLESIWDIGMRNPWRFSFDRLTGDMWIADVGQNLYEEIDFEPAASGGGFNYGWRCYEADDEFSAGGCESMSYYTFPIFHYSHSMSTGGFAVVGGFVYRGSLYPGMQGYYMCGDEVSGNWWTITSDGSGGWTTDFMPDMTSSVSTFGEATDGEIYCAELGSGKIYHLTDACGNFALSATSVDYNCGVTEGSIDVTITEGTAPFNISWNTGAETEDLTGLDSGSYTITVTDDIGCKRTLDITINDIPAFTVSVTVDGNTLMADGGAEWQWYMDGTLIPGATAQNYTADASGTYTVLVTDAAGCTVMSDDVPFVFVGLSDHADEQEIIIFPNPVTDDIGISISSANAISNAEFRVTDMAGKVVFVRSFDIPAGKTERHFAADNLAAGIYNVIYTSSDISRNMTVVISK